MNFRIFFIITTLLTFTTNYTQPSDRKILFIPFDCTSELPFHQNALPFSEDIFLGPVYTDLVYALNAKNCIILTNSTLLHNLIISKAIFKSVVEENKAFHEFKRLFGHLPQFKTVETVQQYYAYMKEIWCYLYTLSFSKQFPNFLNKNTIIDLINKRESHSILHYNHPHFHPMQRYLLSYAAQFNPEEWLIKQASSNLYLLIPKNYLQSLRNKYPQETDNQILSLNISNFPNISPVDLTQRAFTAPYLECPAASDELTAVFNSKTLFNSTEDCDVKNKWTIIMSGHGFPATSSDEMQIAGHKHSKFLELCTSIDTCSNVVKRLFITTCGSGGQTSFTLFQHPHTKEQLHFSYDIFTVGIMRAAVLGVLPQFSPLYNLELFTQTNKPVTLAPNKFISLAQLQSPQKKGGDVIINELWPYYNTTQKEFFPNNLIIYRAAYEKTSKPLELTNIAHRLSSTLLEDHEISLIDLSIPSLPQAIVIEKACINKTLFVPETAADFPKMLSFLNEQKPFHYIKKIEAKGCSLKSIMQAFFSVINTWEMHIWNIGTIETQNETIHNVFVVQRGRSNKEQNNLIIFVASDKKIYCITWNPDKLKGDFDTLLTTKQAIEPFQRTIITDTIIRQIRPQWETVKKELKLNSAPRQIEPPVKKQKIV